MASSFLVAACIALLRKEVKSFKVIAEWTALEGQAGREFLKGRLGELAQQRSDLERGVAQVEAALAQAKEGRVTSETVPAALARIGEVYDCLKPLEQKELMRLVLRRTEVGDKQIVLELNGTGYAQADEMAEMAMAQSLKRLESPDWLTILDKR